MIWVRPVWWREISEFLRIICQLRVWPHILLWKYLRGQMVQISDETWKTLQDTDSWRTTDKHEVIYVQSERQEMDWDPYPISEKLSHAFIGDSLAKVFAPIIIDLHGGGTHLVSGNRRLMLARAHGIRPTCFVI